MSWNTVPMMNGANWSGNAQLATKNQLLSSISGLYTDLEDFEFSTISVANLTVSTLIASETITAPQAIFSSIQANTISSSGFNIDASGTIIANVISSQVANFGLTIVSSLSFQASLEPNLDLSIDLGFGAALGGLLGGLGAAVGGLFIGVGTLGGLAIQGIAEGIGTIIAGRPQNFINSNVYEGMNYNTQFQFSTLGYAQPFYSSIFRTISSPSANQVPGQEIFISTIFPAGTKCVRSASDPFTLITSSTQIFGSSLQAFGEWVPLQNELFDFISSQSITSRSSIAYHLIGQQDVSIGADPFNPGNTSYGRMTTVFDSLILQAGLANTPGSASKIAFAPMYTGASSNANTIDIANGRIGVACNSPQYTLDVNGNTNIKGITSILSNTFITGDLNVSGQIFGASTFIIPTYVGDRIVLRNEIISTVYQHNDIDILTSFYKPSTFLSSMGWISTANITNPQFINQTNISDYFSTLIVGDSNQSTFLLTATYPNSTILDYYQSTGSGIFRYYQNGNASFVDVPLTTPASNRFTFNFLSNSWYDSGTPPTPPYGLERFPVSSIVGSAQIKVNTGQNYNEIYSDKPLYLSTSELVMERLRPYQYLPYSSTHTAEKIESEFFRVSTVVSSIGFLKEVSSSGLETFLPASNYVSTLVAMTAGANGLAQAGNPLTFIDFKVASGQSNGMTWETSATTQSVSSFGAGTHRLSNNGLAFPNWGFVSIGSTPTPPYGLIGFPTVFTDTTELAFYNNVSTSLISTNKTLTIQAQSMTAPAINGVSIPFQFQKWAKYVSTFVNGGQATGLEATNLLTVYNILPSFTVPANFSNDFVQFVVPVWTPATDANGLFNSQALLPPVCIDFKTKLRCWQVGDYDPLTGFSNEWNFSTNTIGVRASLYSVDYGISPPLETAYWDSCFMTTNITIQNDGGSPVPYLCFNGSLNTSNFTCVGNVATSCNLAIGLSFYSQYLSPPNYRSNTDLRFNYISSGVNLGTTNTRYTFSYLTTNPL